MNEGYIPLQLCSYAGYIVTVEPSFHIYFVTDESLTKIIGDICRFVRPDDPQNNKILDGDFFASQSRCNVLNVDVRNDMSIWE